MRELRDLGEEAPDLELRVDAGAQAPIALEEQALAELHRGVGALGVERAELQRRELAADELLVSLRAREAQLAFSRRQAAPGADRFHDVPAEALVADRIGEHADVGLLADARDRDRG